MYRRPGRKALLVVQTDPLRDMLLRFVADWNQDGRSSRGAPSLCASARPLSAIEYISSEAGVGASTVAHMIGPTPSPTTLLATADAIVTAIGRSEAFYDGTLEVKLRRKSGELVDCD